ncbi:hypothetical protein PFISCL1PPCAC_12975, partial [Pristionchus fissidentatus]
KQSHSFQLLVPALTCTDGWADVIRKFNLTSAVNVQMTALVAMMQTQWPAACASVPPSIFDAVIAEAPNPLINMPDAYRKCADGPAKEFMYKYIELLAGAGANFNALRLKRVAGVLANELLGNSNETQVANCASTPCPGQPKLRVYYTVEARILIFISLFKYNCCKGVTPAFSSAVVFETRRADNGWPYVKVI